MLDHLLGGIFLGSLIFLLWFGATRAWWRAIEGWALMVSAAGWMLLGGGLTYDRYVAEVPDDVWVLIAGWAFVAVCMKLALLVLGRHRRP